MRQSLRSSYSLILNLQLQYESVDLIQNMTIPSLLQLRKYLEKVAFIVRKNVLKHVINQFSPLSIMFST